MRVWRAVSFAGLILLLSSSAYGQSNTAQSPTDVETVSEKVVNPIAILSRFTFENKYSPSLWDSGGEENQVEGEFIIPFVAFARQNLTRIKILFETSKPDGTHGLSELEIFNLVLFPRKWGTFAAGITAQLTAETSNSLGAVAPGPAVAAVVRHGKWKYGLFNQNFLSDTVAQTELQPILAYVFNRKWSTEIGDAQYTSDWKKDRVTSIPLSGQLNRIASLQHQDIHLFFRAQYNAKNDSGSDKWTLSAGFSLIVQPNPEH
jgi:hypothetical protein